MADSLLEDKFVQTAVSRVQLRAERQQDIGQLVETFVDPGITVQLQNENNQILYGRRGTGKTHVLRVVQSGASSEPDALAVYVDMRRLGSSSVFNDEGRPTHVRVASLLRDVLAEVESALLEWATRPDSSVGSDVFEGLDALSTAITRTVMSQVGVVEEASTTADKSATRGAAVAISASPSLELSSKDETSLTDTEKLQRSGVEIEPLYFQEIATALEGLFKKSGLSRLTVLLDEWTAIPLDLQPLFAEFLKRSLFPIPQITVKIASLEYRSNFSERLEKNNVLGFELGADISSSLELDDYYVFDRNPERTIEMFSELLYRHVTAEIGSNGKSLYLSTEHGIATSGEFVKSLFASPEAFQELVRAGEGVARDLINIFGSAFFNSLRRKRKSIDRRAVQDAAREWYEKDKAPNVDQAQGRILRRIVDDVIGTRKARSFLLEKELETNEVIRSLFDFRIIHLVKRGFADKDNPGLRHNIYTLDYGCYVDLLGTQKAPGGDFTEELATEGEEVVVPFDDRRSIRRIILRAEHLASNQ